MKIDLIALSAAVMISAPVWAQVEEGTAPTASPSATGTGYPVDQNNIGNPKAKPSRRDGRRLPNAGKQNQQGKGASKTTSAPANSGTETTGEGAAGGVPDTK